MEEKLITKWAAIKVVFWFIIGLGIGWVTFPYLVEPRAGRTYDCSLSEFHPDYPVKVKEQCRELKREK